MADSEKKKKEIENRKFEVRLLLSFLGFACFEK
jgi:hypothetical protein